MPSKKVTMSEGAKLMHIKCKRAMGMRIEMAKAGLSRLPALVSGRESDSSSQ
jgi:hypothetical protein